MSRWVKLFSTHDGHPELIDDVINKWLISNPSFNLIDIKYKIHYNDNAWTDVVIVVYESSQEPYVDWKKGEQQA
jgi:hypothetical protein